MPCLDPTHLPDDHRGARAHRFMESADIGCAFRETFVALRANLRRGLRTSGQIYALEMDPCIAGELLDTHWLPPADHGLPADEADSLPDSSCADRPEHEREQQRERHAVLHRLLQRPGAAQLLVWVGERADCNGHPVVRVEVASADGLFAAEHLVCPGRSRHQRDLLRVPHRRCASDALA